MRWLFPGRAGYIVAFPLVSAYQGGGCSSAGAGSQLGVPVCSAHADRAPLENAEMGAAKGTKFLKQVSLDIKL